jgi:hypothetical protein
VKSDAVPGGANQIVDALNRTEYAAGVEEIVPLLAHRAACDFEA